MNWTRNVWKKRKSIRDFRSKRKEGRGVKPLPPLFRTGNQQPQPLFPHRRRRMIRIQQESQPPPLLPHPQFQLFPQPPLPHRQERMMIQRIQLQELFPNPGKLFPPPLFPHPQPQFVSQPQPQFVLSSAQPQFVAAKSLIFKASRIGVHFIL